MIYNLISSKIVIARIFDEYNIDYSGFISRVPNWIYNALRSFKFTIWLEPKITPATVIGYKCNLPNDIEELVAISYMGFRLERGDNINENVPDDMANLMHPYAKYQLNPNGYIVTSFETGDIKFYTKSYKTELDTESNILFPMIVNNEDLITALVWYVLRNLLYRGHTIKNLSLASNNAFLNPALAWEKHKVIAKNSICVFDDDDMELLSQLSNSFLLDYNRYNNSLNSNIL